MSDLVIRPVTPELWPDLVTLFGDRGASSGCWCQWFRVTPSQWSRNGNAGNRAALERLVGDGRRPGLLAYREDLPVGWMSLGPRQDFARIEPAPVAEEGVWSVVCFYIGAGQRRRGVAAALLRAGIDFARRAGAGVLEAYPVERPNASNADSFTGPRALFEKAGFTPAGRFERWSQVAGASGSAPSALRTRARATGRPIMRLAL